MHHTALASVLASARNDARNASLALARIAFSAPPRTTRKARKAAHAKAERQAANALVRAEGALLGLSRSVWVGCSCGAPACAADMASRIAGTVL